jgi:hypothetical protein
MIIPALRASIVLEDAHPDLTVGAISSRRFAPVQSALCASSRECFDPANFATGPKGRIAIAPTVGRGYGV